MSDLLETCAREIMETIPPIFQSIKSEMRRGRSAELSVPQFRTMRFIQRNADSSLSSLAEHLDLTLPTVSKLVDGLVKQELVVRQESASDRRCLSLVLTPAGDAIVNSARASAQASLAGTLSALSPNELEAVHRALELLQPLFPGTGRAPHSIR